MARLSVPEPAQASKRNSEKSEMKWLKVDELEDWQLPKMSTSNRQGGAMRLFKMIRNRFNRVIEADLLCRPLPVHTRDRVLPYPTRTLRLLLSAGRQCKPILNRNRSTMSRNTFGTGNEIITIVISNRSTRMRPPAGKSGSAVSSSRRLLLRTPRR